MPESRLPTSKMQSMSRDNGLKKSMTPTSYNRLRRMEAGLEAGGGVEKGRVFKLAWIQPAGLTSKDAMVDLA